MPMIDRGLLRNMRVLGLWNSVQVAEVPSLVSSTLPA